MGDFGRAVVGTHRRWNRLSKRRVALALALALKRVWPCVFCWRRHSGVEGLCNQKQDLLCLLNSQTEAGTQLRWIQNKGSYLKPVLFAFVKGRGCEWYWEGIARMVPSELSWMWSASHSFCSFWVYMPTYIHTVQMRDRHPCTAANSAASHLEAKEPRRGFPSYFWEKESWDWKRWFTKIIISNPS